MHATAAGETRPPFLLVRPLPYASPVDGNQRGARAMTEGGEEC
jgi:hypothetical protein